MTPENIRIQGDVDLFPPNLKNFVATVVLREQALADRSRLIAACKGVVEQRHRCNAIATLFGGRPGDAALGSSGGQVNELRCQLLGFTCNERPLVKRRFPEAADLKDVLPLSWLRAADP